jgi:processive 1,2-diacylglycerol beta-glucosyltransferase
VVPTGIPVRAAFAAIPPARLREPGEPLRVLITSGGFGVGPVLRVLRSFAGVRAVELTVVCGQNPELVTRVQHASDRFGLGARVIGFEPQMAERVAEAHVVVTKPGGLTVTECLVAGRPLLLVGAVPGQESLNQAWVTQSGAGLGVSARSVGSMAAALAQRGELEKMAERARGLAARDAASSILQQALARAGELAA